MTERLVTDKSSGRGNATRGGLFWGALAAVLLVWRRLRRKRG